MKVAELIEQLGMYDPQADVHLRAGPNECTYYLPSVQCIEEDVIKYSYYHLGHRLVEEDEVYNEETGDYNEGVTQVVIIS
jgi:hypothetical protein